MAVWLNETTYLYVYTHALRGHAMPCSDRICETNSSERNILSDGPDIGQMVS